MKATINKYFVNTTNDVHKIETKIEKRSVYRAREVANVTINKSGVDGYTKEETNALLNTKIDVPDVDDWANFLLIITN